MIVGNLGSYLGKKKAGILPQTFYWTHHKHIYPYFLLGHKFKSCKTKQNCSFENMGIFSIILVEGSSKHKKKKRYIWPHKNVNALNDKNISQNKSAKLRNIVTTPNAKTSFLMEDFVNCSSHLPHISTFLEWGCGEASKNHIMVGNRWLWEGRWGVRLVWQHSCSWSQDQASSS